MKADLRGLRAGLHVLAGLAVLMAGAPALGASKERMPGVTVEGSRVYDPERDGDPVVNNLERRTFRFFWDTTNKQNGLAPDRYPSPSFASTAGIGFALTAYVIGSERGFVSRSQARLRTLRTLRFLANAPQGPDENGMTGYRGFYYHFLHMQNGQRFGTSELSTVDTALLLGGVLLAQMYFDRDTRAEREIRELADLIYGRVEWTWAQNRPPIISHGWRPETGFLRFDWRGYNEAMLVYILALGSPTHPIEPEAWKEWLATYKGSWGQFSGQEFLSFGPMFGHQYSHVWIDFRGIQDEFMREKGIDYFENSRRATYAHREYSVQNPMRWRGYDSEIWGLSACDGPADTVQIFNNEERGFFTYCGARHGRHACARRRHDRADCGGRLHRVRARDRDPDDPRVPRALRREPVSEVRLPRRGQPELHVSERAAASRPHRRERRLVRHRLPQHRPGPDRGDDRELSQRAHLEAHAAQSAHPPRPGARRLHRRLARTAAAATAELVSR